MFRTFNMGIGLIVVCPGADAGAVQAGLAQAGERGAAVIGEIVAGDRRVVYE
jgi:phosphoribosylaminoimidazole (AIR) synthetase